MLIVPALAVAGGLFGSGMGAPAVQNTPATASSYHFKTVATHRKAETFLTGINRAGEYVGGACGTGCSGRFLSFVSTAGGKRTYFTPRFANFDAAHSWGTSGIDDGGDVTGGYQDSHGDNHGYVRRADGTFEQLNDPLAVGGSGNGTIAEGISANGSVIVGVYAGRAGASDGFILMHGKFKTYDVPGAASTAIGFYYHGEFGGNYANRNGALFGFYVLHGHLHTVAAPGLPHPAKGQGAVLVGVSAAGTVYGDEFSSGPAFGFTYRHGRYTRIKDPSEVGRTSLDGTFINNADLAGTLAGSYSVTPGTKKAGGDQEGFIATASG